MNLGGTCCACADWVCASSACSFHNFARNDTCFGCGSAKPVSGVSATSEASHVRSPNRSAMPTLTRQPSSLNLGTAYSATSGLAPRHQATSSPQSSDSPSTPDLHSQYLDPFLTTSIRGPLSGPQPLPNLDKVMDMPASQQQPASTLAAAFQLHQMGVGIGPGVNPAISSASPCQGQARGSESKGSSSIDQNNPPIVNTGNSGPMCVQPGDWFCGQCGFVVSICLVPRLSRRTRTDYGTR